MLKKPTPSLCDKVAGCLNEDSPASRNTYLWWDCTLCWVLSMVHKLSVDCHGMSVLTSTVYLCWLPPMGSAEYTFILSTPLVKPLLVSETETFNFFYLMDCYLSLFSIISNKSYTCAIFRNKLLFIFCNH